LTENEPTSAAGIRAGFALIKPIGIYPYFDKVQVWLRFPADPEEIARLERQCGDFHHENRPARFNRQLRQRLEFKQPKQEALEWIAGRADALINRLEVTIDYIFDSLAQRCDAWDFLDRHLVRSWHGKNQKIRISKSDDGHDQRHGTRYDAGRRSPQEIALYPEEQSRITGEPYCLHLEWRLNRLKTVHAAGIKSGRDLLEFSHREFWRKRLRLYDVDKRRLGRLIRNRAEGTRRRTSKVEQISKYYRINRDGRTGQIYADSYDTVQELIDRLKSLHRINRALIPISNEDWLPE